MFIQVKYKKRNDKDSIPRSSVYAVRHVNTWPPRYISGTTYPFRYRTFDENKIVKMKYMGVAVRNIN